MAVGAPTTISNGGFKVPSFETSGNGIVLQKIYSEIYIFKNS
jgi:hypothetical protein